MRVKIAFTAVTLTTLSVVLFTGCDPSAPENQPRRVSPCVEANQLPPYTARYEDGSRVSVPSGAELVAEAQANGDDLNRACLGIVAQYREDERAGRIVKP